MCVCVCVCVCIRALKWYMQNCVEIIYTELLLSPFGAVANVLNNDIVVSEFELQSYDCVHFRINNIWNKYEPPYPLTMG